MPDFANPYTPGQAVTDPARFFGRRDLLASIQEHLLKGRRVFLVSGARRMGKTSLLRYLSAQAPEGWIPVRVDLLEENAQGPDWLLWRLADAVGQQIGLVLGTERLEPAWSDFEGHTQFFLDRFWPQVRAQLGDRSLMLLMDDLDALDQPDGYLLDALIAVLSAWRERDEGVAFVLTASVTLQEDLVRKHPHLFGGALTHVLGSLRGEEATRLITWPVDGAITYDYGVARRLIEITSGHPYYLQLLCFEVARRCAQAGWVNQRDVDLVLENLVSRENPDFRKVWDESSPQEQAVLAALVSLRGARGVATTQDVRTVLTKAGARSDRGQVGQVLEHLRGARHLGAAGRAQLSLPGGPAARLVGGADRVGRGGARHALGRQRPPPSAGGSARAETAHAQGTAGAGQSGPQACQSRRCGKRGPGGRDSGSPASLVWHFVGGSCGADCGGCSELWPSARLPQAWRRPLHACGLRPRSGWLRPRQLTWRGPPRSPWPSPRRPRRRPGCRPRRRRPRLLPHP